MNLNKVNTNLTKFLSISLFTIGVGTCLVGCKQADVITVIDTDDTEIIETHEQKPTEVEKDIVFDEVEVYEESLYDKLLKIETSGELHEFYNQNALMIDDVLNPEYRDIQMQYASMAYKRLLSYNIDTNAIETELHTLLLEQQIPRCMSEEEWNYSFANISKTTDENNSLFSSYFVLAFLIDEEKTNSEYYYNEFGAISSKELKDELYTKHGLEKEKVLTLTK